MMQNKLLFHQSSVSLEIIGLPDYSNNENKDQISIISQWKLTIIDKPLIEGKFEHLGPIMDAFYIYSNLLIKNEIPIYESELIDIKADNLHIHNIVLKSSKPNELDALIQITVEMSRYLYPYIREILKSTEDLEENSVIWNDFNKRFIELIKERFNLDSMKVKKLLNQAENDEIIIKSLLILSFSISNHGYQKLKNFLYDF